MPQEEGSPGNRLLGRGTEAQQEMEEGAQCPGNMILPSGTCFTRCTPSLPSTFSRQTILKHRAGRIGDANTGSRKEKEEASRGPISAPKSFPERPNSTIRAGTSVYDTLTELLAPGRAVGMRAGHGNALHPHKRVRRDGSSG
ncbi:Hypp4179 [Branchiostoma lanceolatum]|uniref:Hypp4179 protein n=1 Tax=Branchiostoma lanceolatum TaxID=7740 RepID=A0A8K0A7F0_BRALA|nr:Hypp4179 [Branchiostoma lanceolatum]